MPPLRLLPARRVTVGEALVLALPMTTNGKVLSINVGAVREFEHKGRPAKSAIWKTPVVGRIAARGVNLEGDDQADREAHGGPDKALYAYAVEDLRWWEEELARSPALEASRSPAASSVSPGPRGYSAGCTRPKANSTALFSFSA